MNNPQSELIRWTFRIPRISWFTLRIQCAYRLSIRLDSSPRFERTARSPSSPLEDFTEFSADSMEPGAASSGWWNTLFIIGLMIAGLLILAVHCVPNFPRVCHHRQSGRAVGPSFQPDGQIIPRQPDDSGSKSSEFVLNAPESAASQVTITKRAEDTAVYSEPRSDSAIAAQLVATNEWFGHELHSRAVSANPEVPRESNRTEPPVFEFSTFERPLGLLARRSLRTFRKTRGCLPHGGSGPGIT